MTEMVPPMYAITTVEFNIATIITQQSWILYNRTLKFWTIDVGWWPELRFALATSQWLEQDAAAFLQQGPPATKEI